MHDGCVTPAVNGGVAVPGACLLGGDVFRPGSMAPFAPDRAFMKPHAMEGTVNGFGTSGVADQAIDRDGTFE